jgi:hypothetical protein
MKAILILISTFSVMAAAAENCPTDILKPLVGSYSGVASIVTYDNGFALQRPKPLAPKSIHSQSVFALDNSNPCHEFHVKIDYLNPKLVADLTGKQVVREVQFDGQSTGQEGLFTLSDNGTLHGHFLRVIDDHTFMATFDAPNPLNPSQQTSCKEFISLTTDGIHIVRTIQCFDSRSGGFVEDRLTLEKFN